LIGGEGGRKGVRGAGWEEGRRGDGQCGAAERVVETETEIEIEMC